MMHALGIFLFTVAAGFTASAIAANLYRISGFKVKSPRGEVVRSAVLVLAGPSVIFENAVRGFAKKAWKPISFWLVTAGVFYWSLAIGLLVVQVATHL